MRIRTRDAIVATGATLSTLGAVALAQGGPQIVKSTAFDWAQMKVEPNANGALRQIMRGPTPTLRELEMHVTTLNPGKAPHPPHSHGHEELMIVRDGDMEVLIDGEWKKISPGSVVFNPSNSYHGWRNGGTTPASYFVLTWRTESTPAPAPTAAPTPAK